MDNNGRDSSMDNSSMDTTNYDTSKVDNKDRTIYVDPTFSLTTFYGPDNYFSKKLFVWLTPPAAQCHSLNSHGHSRGHDHWIFS